MTLCNLVGGYEGLGGTSSHHPQSDRFIQYVDDRIKDRAMSNSRKKHPKLNRHANHKSRNKPYEDRCMSYTHQTINTFSGEPLKINVLNRISNEYEYE
jgi:hypothetical protein